MARSKKTVAPKTHQRATDEPVYDREREDWIATAAYYLAEKRGFAPGGEMADWLVAEHRYLDRSGVA